MADRPEAKKITISDKTSALVAAGLVLLAVAGVGTVFSDSIAAAWSPPAGASESTTAAAPAPAPVPAAATLPATRPAAAPSDGGHA